MLYQDAICQIEKTLLQRPPQRLKIAGFVPAAVIIPLFAKNEQAHMLLTLRTDKVEHHKGQVSFPGGAKESQDTDLAQTALRETHEEVGITPEKVSIIGQLDDFPTITSFLVTPFVATIPYPYETNPSDDEVEEILEVPLAIFLSPQHFEMKEKEYNGKTYPIYYYYFQNAVIWGVTGFIVNRFIELVFGFNPAPKSILTDPMNEEYLLRNIQESGRRKKNRNK